MAIGLSEGPSYSGLSSHSIIFSRCFPLNDRRRAAFSLSNIGRLSLLFSCPFFARIRIFLLLSMSSNVHAKPGPVFPCSVCARNGTMCSLLSSSKFFLIHIHALGSSYLGSCLFYCVSASFVGSHPFNIVTFSSSGPLIPLVFDPSFLAPPLPMQHPSPTSTNSVPPFYLCLPTFYPPSTHFVTLLSALPHSLLFLAVLLHLQLPLPS